MFDAWTVYTAGKRGLCTQRKKVDGSVIPIGVVFVVKSSHARSFLLAQNGSSWLTSCSDEPSISMYSTRDLLWLLTLGSSYATVSYAVFCLKRPRSA
jgi:hypothetical protein